MNNAPHPRASATTTTATDLQRRKQIVCNFPVKTTVISLQSQTLSQNMTPKKGLK
jgi:hypothetical protein